MDRGHKNKALLQHVSIPFPETTEKEMYEKRYKKMLQSQKPKKPPKISREMVFETEVLSAKKVQNTPGKINANNIFISDS